MHTAPTLGVVTTDRHFAIRGWNGWVAAATGLTESDVIGRSVLEFVAPDRRSFYRDLLTEIIDSGSARVLAPAFHHYLIKCPPQAPSPYFDHMQQRATIAPLMAGESSVGLMITLEDVTARLDRERAVAAMVDPAGPRHRTEALASDDWQIRGQAIHQLKQSASVEEVRHLFDTLHRDHQDLNILNSALHVLIAAGRTVVEPLVELLTDRAANLRMHAALALGELKAQEATPQLVSTLDDPDDNVRFHAIEALGRIGAVESIVPLARIAASDNFFLAFAAVEALSKTDDARVAPLMVSLLDQELLRPAAVTTLAAIGDEDCVPALARALNDEHSDAAAIADALLQIHQRYDENLGAGGVIAETVREQVTAAGRDRLARAVTTNGRERLAAASVLGWLGRDALDALIPLVGDDQVHSVIGDGVLAAGGDAVPPLIELLDSAVAATRIAAADLLGRLGDRRATAALLQATEDAEADVAAAAAAALGGLGDSAALDGLVSLFSHPSATVRRSAIAAINSIGAPATAARVRSVMTHTDPRVRESAIRVAGYFGFRDTASAIVAALKDPGEDVRRAAIEQLPVLDEVDAAAKLIAAMAAETPRNRAAAAHALRQVDDPRAAAALHDALQDGDAWVRYFAAASLGERASARDADALATLARRDPAPHVRIAAINALGAVNPQLAARAAAELINDADDNIAIAAISVLGSIGRPDGHVLLGRAARSSRPALQRASINALARRPSVEAVEVLAWAARVGDDQALSRSAVDALRRIGAEADHPFAQRAAIAALRELAAEGSRRLEVIAAIARLPEFVVPEIASGLSAGRVGVRVATANALAAMRHPRASSELARALRDEDPTVRAAAIAGFAKLGTPAVARTIAAMRQTDPDEDVRRRAELACARHGWGSGPVLRT